MGRRAAVRNLNTGTTDESIERRGFFEHCSGTMNVSEALRQIGYEFLGGSKIDEYALEFQRRAHGLADAVSVDFSTLSESLLERRNADSLS